MTGKGPGLFSDFGKKSRDLLFNDYSSEQKLTVASFSDIGVGRYKGNSLRVAYLYLFEQLNGGAVVGEISRKFSTNENTLTVGCSYVV